MKIYNTRQVKRLYRSFQKLMDNKMGEFSALSQEVISFLLASNPELEISDLFQILYILNVSGEYLHRNNLYEDTKIKILDDGTVVALNNDKWEPAISAYYTLGGN